MNDLFDAPRPGSPHGLCLGQAYLEARSRHELVSSFAEIRPVGGFDFIMADPPWRYEERSELGDKRKSVHSKYQTMTPAEIAAVPVEVLAATHSILWLWATNPMLDRAFEVMATWGFTFKTAGTWVKRTKTGKLGFGTGYWLRCSNEPFLIGTRGRVKVKDRGIRSAFEGVTRDHSRKPEECFPVAERMWPDCKRLELFSRTNRPGWISWGDEKGKFDEQGTSDHQAGRVRGGRAA